MTQENSAPEDLVARKKITHSFMLQKLRLQKEIIEKTTGRREDIKVYFREAKTILYEQG